MYVQANTIAASWMPFVALPRVSSGEFQRRCSVGEYRGTRRRDGQRVDDLRGGMQSHASKAGRQMAIAKEFAHLAVSLFALEASVTTLSMRLSFRGLLLPWRICLDCRRHRPGGWMHVDIHVAGRTENRGCLTEANTDALFT